LFSKFWLKVADFKAKEPDFKPSCYYTNTKAREINDSKLIAIDYYLT
jgi:hypothetical protein